jgi:hypothetical protein
MKLLLPLFFFLSTVSNEKETGLLIQPDMVMLVVDHNASLKELVQYQEELKAKANIDFRIKQVSFDDQGKLLSLSYSVDCNDGFSGGSSHRFTNETQKIGFYRRGDENIESPFMVGNMPALPK